MPPTGPLLIWLILALAGAVATAWWARRLWKRRNELPPRARAIATLVALAAMLGTLGTVLGLIKAIGAIGGQSADPSQKARILSEGMCQAMNCTVLGLVVWLPSVALLAFMKKRST